MTRPSRRCPGASDNGVVTVAVPPGWPKAVPPPEVDGWQRRAVGWLLDLCPPDYRGAAVLQRHPVVLAHLAAHHVEGQVEAQRRAAATLRAALAGQVPPAVVEEALEVLDAEEARLLDARRGVRLLADALRGRRYVPRL